ncbi:STAS domain-containing protein [Actinomadura vinacea]
MSTTPSATHDPAARLSIDDRREGRWTVHSVNGELDLTTAHRLERDVIARIAAPPRGHPSDSGVAVALELPNLVFCDSSGLNALVRIWRAVQRADGELVLLNPIPQLLRILKTTGLDQYLDVRFRLPE